MPDESKANEPGAVWRSQPEEKIAVNPQVFLNHRTRELYARTRAEIITSITAALLFVGIIAWRFWPASDRLQQAGFLIVIAWVLATLYRFRDRIWRREPPSPDAIAAPGLEFYRRELERRRDHLRNEWLWHGPLVLACLICVVTFVGRAFPGVERVRGVLPLVVLLAAWTAIGLHRRRRLARELQREIDEIQSP
jgi:hypothetical protein